MFPDGVHPASWYQSANPVFIILFAPFFAWLWTSLGARNLDPSSPAKFGLGLILLGLGFLVMMFAAQTIVATGGRSVPTWLLLAYLIHTFGELCLSPVGLSNITKLAPQRFVGQMMGTWFLGSAVGNLFAGLIGGHIASAEVASLPALFLQMTLIGVGAGIVMLLLARPLRSWIGDAK
jgi:POT family proton-dependent oligopeptide transporter